MKAVEAVGDKGGGRGQGGGAGWVSCCLWVAFVLVLLHLTACATEKSPTVDVSPSNTGGGFADVAVVFFLVFTKRVHCGLYTEGEAHWAAALL